ncbi:MAG: murein biosynthesis integral membrane protein MurJ, partial [Chloroflexia bacterium]|nr:murein biosynthesis integral membrane protein MurJ [Chloroflexia bacterium]
YDAYVAAFRIPDLLFLVVMSGAFGSAFIPVFGGFLARGEDERAWRLANAVLTYTILILAILAQLVLLFAGPLVSRVIAPELPPESQQLATNLTRLLLLSPLLLGLGAAGKDMLEARDAFTLPAIAPLLYNLGIIFGTVALTPVLGVYGLVVGVILGAVGHAGLQFASLIRGGRRFRPNLSRHTAGLAEVGRLMAPRIAGQAVFQANLIVMTNFASRLGEGTISALNYALQLYLLPHGVLALSLSTVLFPHMTRQFELGRRDEMMGTLDRAIGVLVFLTIPAMIGLIVFRTSIVQVVFQHGAFTAESAALVAEALGYLACGLLAVTVVEVVTQAFYAMHDARTPVITAILTVGANIAMSWLLVGSLGHGGLALSLAITAIIRMVVLLVILARRTEGFGPTIASSLPRVALAGASMVTVALLLMEPLRRWTDPATTPTLGAFGALALALIVTGLTYLIAAHALRIPEFTRLVHAIQGRVQSERL